MKTLKMKTKMIIHLMIYVYNSAIKKKVNLILKKYLHNRLNNSIFINFVYN
jgi:hypothetical protein